MKKALLCTIFSLFLSLGFAKIDYVQAANNFRSESTGMGGLGATVSPDTAVKPPAPQTPSGQQAAPTDPNVFVGPNVTAPKSFVSNIQGCIDSGNCSLCDVLKFFGTIAQWILATVGALALTFFVLGGFDLIMSQGKQETVEKGKKKITGALIGLLVVLGAYFIINAVINFAAVDTKGQVGVKGGRATQNIFKWNDISCE